MFLRYEEGRSGGKKNKEMTGVSLLLCTQPVGICQYDGIYAGLTAAAAAAAAESLLGQQQRCIDGHELLCSSFQNTVRVSVLVFK